MRIHRSRLIGLLVLVLFARMALAAPHGPCPQMAGDAAPEAAHQGQLMAHDASSPRSDCCSDHQAGAKDNRGCGMEDATTAGGHDCTLSCMAGHCASAMAAVDSPGVHPRLAGLPPISLTLFVPSVPNFPFLRPPIL